MQLLLVKMRVVFMKYATNKIMRLLKIHKSCLEPIFKSGVDRICVNSNNANKLAQILYLDTIMTRRLLPLLTRFSEERFVTIRYC